MTNKGERGAKGTQKSYTPVSKLKIQPFGDGLLAWLVTSHNEEPISEETRKKLLDQKNKDEDMVKLYLRRHRRYLTTLVMFVVQIVTAIMAVYLVMNLEPATSTVPYLNWVVPQYWLIFSTVLFNLVFYSIMTWISIRTLRQHSRSICFHASVSGAESIAQGKMVEGAFHVVILFRFIKQYSDEAKVHIGPWNSKIRGLFLGIIENLHESREAIGKAVLNSHEQKEKLSSSLYRLASSFFQDEKNPDYNDALSSLRFFQEMSEKYAEAATFAQRHRRVGSVLRIIGEFMKATIVYILIFVLWMTFGFR